MGAVRVMALQQGARLGAYEITSLIGAGGMGEVYRARDTRLGRDVAIKVLPSQFALDPERLARFTREAQVLASLNHPNIAAIYGFEESARWFSNTSMARRWPIASGAGALPLDEALPIARQIADALEAAHEQQIIHRDLKPANVKLRPDGTVKVLDFGLAKLMPGPAEAGHHDAVNLTCLADDHHAGDDDGRCHPRHRRVYEPRAGEGTPRRQAQRHLGLRVRALRNAHRQAAVRRRRRQRHARRRAARRAGLERRYQARRRAPFGRFFGAVSRRIASDDSPMRPTRDSSSTMCSSNRRMCRQPRPRAPHCFDARCRLRSASSSQSR